LTRDDIIRMARESGFEVDSDDVWITDGFWVEELERFAKLVAAAEREACADIAENWRCNGMPRTVLADQIRARGAP
jgi:hypothetical protein